MIPAWLQRHLENTGAWNTDGISRRVRATVCRGCGTQVLRGLDDNRCALPAVADPEPLDPAGELIALVNGRATYRLRHTSGKWEMDRRDQHDIQRQPAGTVDVIAEHKCREPIPSNGPPIENPQPLRTVEEKCPF